MSDSLTSMDFMQDIHICGGCRLEFSDIEKFISHKKLCVLKMIPLQTQDCSSTFVGLPEQQLPGLSMQEEAVYLVTKSTHLDVGRNESQNMHFYTEQVSASALLTSDSAQSEVSCMTEIPFQSSLTALRTGQPQTQKLTGVSLLSKALTCNPNDDLLKTVIHSLPQSNDSCTKEPPDIDIYVVNSNTFETKNNKNKNVQKIYQSIEHKVCSQIGQTVTHETLPSLKTNLLTEYKHLDFVDNTVSLMSLNTQDSIVQENIESQDAGVECTLDIVEKDISSHSDSSTPCPEDLEVGQISAGMARHSNQYSLKTLLEFDQQVNWHNRDCESKASKLNNCSKTSKSGVTDLNFDFFKGSLAPIPNFIRENTASAPITNQIDHTIAKQTEKKAFEKRERLQGVSDDLLSSPYFSAQSFTTQNADLVQSKADISTTGTTILQTGSRIKHDPDRKILELPVSGAYQAVFTSPSSAGHRLAPTQMTGPSTSNVLTSTNMNCPVSMEFKDISASVKQPEDYSVGIKGNVGKAGREINFVHHPEELEIEDVKENLTSSWNEVSIQAENLLHDKEDGGALESSSSNLNVQQSSPTGSLAPTRSYIQKYNIVSMDPPELVAKSEHLDSLTNADMDGPEINKNDVVSLHGSSTELVNSTENTSSDGSTVIMVYKQDNGNMLVFPNNRNQFPVPPAENISHLAETQPVLLQQGTGGSIEYVQDQGNNTQALINIQPVTEVATPANALSLWPPNISTQCYVAKSGSHEREKFIMKPRAKKTPAPVASRQPKGAYQPPLIQAAIPNVKVALNLTENVSIEAASTKPPTNGTDSSQSTSPVKKSSPKFHCEYANCSYTTSLWKDVLRHHRTHTGERPFACNDCGKRFNRSDKLKVHARWHSGIKPFQCTLCDYASVESGSLKKHMRIHNDERPYKCQICPYASRNSSQLIVHLRTHTGDSPFHCTMCSAQFKINSDLKRHMRIHTGEKPFQCDKCDYKSTNKGNLKTHYKINHSTVNEKSCPDCEFTTSSTKRFREHVKSHDTKRIVQCCRCDYTCTSLTALRNHMSTHNTVRPFQCHLCPYSSKQKGNLKQHIQNLHQVKFKPSVHGKNFSMSANGPRTVPLKKQKIKGGDNKTGSSSYRRLHQCGQCGCSFVRQDSLKCHMKQHNEEKPVNKDHIGFALKPKQWHYPSGTAAIVPTKSSNIKGGQGIQEIAAVASKAFQEQFDQNYIKTSQDSKHSTTSQRKRRNNEPVRSSKLRAIRAAPPSLEDIKSILPVPSGSNTSVSNSKVVPTPQIIKTDQCPNTVPSVDTASTTIKVPTRQSARCNVKSIFKTTRGNSSLNPLKQTITHSQVPSQTKKVTHSKVSSPHKGKKSKEQVISPSWSQTSLQTSQASKDMPALRQTGSVLQENTTAPHAQSGQSVMLLSQDGAVKSPQQTSYNIQLMPQGTNQGNTQNSNIVAITQEVMRQMGFSQTAPAPTTHIQIVLPGATIPDSSQQFMGVNQALLSPQQQIFIQVPNSSGHTQELITLPLNQGTSGVVNATNQGGPAFIQSAQSHVEQINLSPVQQMALTHGGVPSSSHISSNNTQNSSLQLTTNQSSNHSTYINPSNHQPTNQNMMLHIQPSRLVSVPMQSVNSTH